MIPAFSKAVGGFTSVPGGRAAYHNPGSRLMGHQLPFTLAMLQQILSQGGLRFQPHGPGVGAPMAPMRGAPPGPVAMGPGAGHHAPGMVYGAPAPYTGGSPAGVPFTGTLPAAWQAPPSYVSNNGAFAYGGGGGPVAPSKSGVSGHLPGGINPLTGLPYGV